MSSGSSYSIMIHGGAGALDNVNDGKSVARYLDPVREILEQGRHLLDTGGSALDVVAVCASMLEDNPVFNAGKGSVLNAQGKVEMDAAIMDGRDLNAGAVAAISNIANPIQLAKRVMLETEHVMLIGRGAMQFAQRHQVALVDDEYFHVAERVRQLELARLKQGMMLDHEGNSEVSDDKYGTVGAIARDRQGNLAAATSTGGIVNKMPGRVGDSPLIGSGVYADNETCAVSATGYGEDFMRTVIAKTIADFIYMKGMDAQQACSAAIEYLVRKVSGRGGVIVIDNHGHCAKGYTTRKMIHGWIENAGESFASLT